ncbi:hypothetical protein ONZ43_g3313 [Nemania bipapillata]|uniref:Uncharacterized protein n=1 Tax=Nemania bipapillata TaxID=110536 RepID=A0ACC2IXB7_9PEZI|nr:hypothetical protein ONZ43_g3313 [Nemania bipapillata]
MAPSATTEVAPTQLPIQKKWPQAISASVLHGPKDLRLETRNIERPGDGELQISIRSTGICGSDVSYYKKFANGDLCACEPLCLGHESSGTVVAIGPQVTGFKIGDRVALEVGVPCDQCSICRQGRVLYKKESIIRLSGVTACILSISQPPPGLQGGDEGDGVDIAFECTGKEACMQTCLYATRPGGKVIMVGMGTPIQTVPLSVAHLKEIDILGIFRYANTYATGIRLLSPHSSGGSRFILPSLDNMVTHRFKGLSAAKDAFELASRTEDDNGNLVLKVIIDF